MLQDCGFDQLYPGEDLREKGIMVWLRERVGRPWIQSEMGKVEKTEGELMGKIEDQGSAQVDSLKNSFG